VKVTFLGDVRRGRRIAQATSGPGTPGRYFRYQRERSR
jgi:hypothetical protein